MDAHKRKIIKSKSSNSALVRKVEKKNPKSKSNGQMENCPKTVKKRGVYVENRPVMSLSAHEKNIPKEKKPSPPPRVGRNRFLNSVLTILSKSSTATQCPDEEDPNTKLKPKKSDEKNKLTSSKKEATQIKKESDRVKIKAEPENKKKKFRSRVLNNDRDYADKFEVIQRTKEYRYTPIDSSKEDIKWSDFPKLVKSDEETTGIVNIVKEITEGRKMADAKMEKDPSTLVAESHKNDKKIYNFFVDLIETSFTLYDVEDTRNKPVKSASSSKVKFEIDEQVAQKLQVTKPTMFDDVTQKPSRNYCSVRTDHKWNDDKTDYCCTDDTSYPMSRHYSCQRSKSPVWRHKLKSASFSNSKYRKPKYQNFLSPSTQSLKQKTAEKRIPKKRNLLNILREEIGKDPSVYEAPQSLYEALQAIARNKRKCQKNLRFANVKMKTSDIRDDCMKKQKIMRPSTSFRYSKKTSQNTPKGMNASVSKVQETYDARKRLKSKVPEKDVRKIPKSNVLETPESEYDNSFHSIEVYGFDYDYTDLPKKFRNTRLKKEVSLPYHSSSSECNNCDY